MTSPLRERLADAGAVATALLGAYLALVPYSVTTPAESPAWRAVDLVGGLAAAAALLARRRYPVGVTVGIGVLSVPCTTVWLAVLVAVFALAVRRPWPQALVLAVVLLGTGPLQEILRDRTPGNDSWTVLGWAAFLSVAVVGWGAVLRTRRELVASLRERAERAETEAGLRADAARHAERTRIAREMHDVMAHRLSLVSMHAGALAHRRTASPEEVADALEVIRAGARDALVDLRTVLGVLRDPDTDDEVGSAGQAPQPTLADLPTLLDGVRAAGADVRLRDELDPAPLPDDCGRTLYRVTQEALTNAARHAPGRPVEIVLSGGPGGDAVLDVSNPLPPDTPAHEPGNGLLGIAERVGLAGGRVLAQGARDGRFRVAVGVPWPAP